MLHSSATAWAPATAYVGGDVVRYAGADYYCHAGHTSSADILPTNATYWNTMAYNYIASGGTLVGKTGFRSDNIVSFQALGAVVSGVGAATVLVQGSNEPTPSSASWFTLDTLSLTLGTTVTQDNGSHSAPTKWIRANVSAVTGTGANVACYLASKPL
jgi:hypothetical protein